LRTDAMHLTARGYHRVLRVARMLADLDGAEKVGRARLGEALSYRALADEMRRGEADANKPPRLPIEPVLLTSRSVPKGTNRHRVESPCCVRFQWVNKRLGAAATFFQAQFIAGMAVAQPVPAAAAPALGLPSRSRRPSQGSGAF
jgi:hypothetical protein